MSKKLIAVAAAAALALTGLVVMPTVATATPGPFAVTVEGWETTNTVGRTGATSTGAIQVFVPSNDVLRSVVTDADDVPEGSSTALRLDVVTPGATDAITVTSTGGVKILTETQWDASTKPKTATGTQSVTVSAAAGEAELYVYTTSTTAGTVVVSAAGSSRTLYVQGLSPISNSYKLAFTAPATASISGKVKVTGTVRDMFDNLLKPAQGDLTYSALGGNLSTATVSDFKVDAATSVVTFDVATASTATQFAINVSATTPADAVTAFPGRAVAVFALVSAVDLSTQVTSLTAQVTALQAQLEASRPKATSVTKKKYNTLARKWNAANPGSRVALKK
jgi:hypothetical protein